MKSNIAKNLTEIAMYSAMMVVAQLLLSFVVGVELITVMLASFSAVFGWKKGVSVAVIFSLLRCVLFGFFPSVVTLYLIYYPFLAFVFSLVGKIKIKRADYILSIVASALSTVIFTLLDDIITPLFYGYLTNLTLLKAYFVTSLSVLWVQILNVIISMALLYFPLKNILSRIDGVYTQTTI